MGVGRSRRRSPSQAERTLWEVATRDVRKLTPAHSADPAPASPAEPPPPSVSAIATAALPEPPRSHAPGPVDRMTVERLKRGQVSIDARIDLHGMDQPTAFAALTGFVDHAIRQGHRALLVITGKGAGGHGGGVLRRHAPAWLASAHFAPRILAILPAHNRHGGDGALYVLLRRRRESR